MSSNEYMLAYMKKRHKQRREMALTILGGKCQKCGSIEKLELHHRKKDEKSFTIGDMWNTSLQKFLDEIKKCDLLCRKCHELETFHQQGKTPAKGKHGTISSYRYCHCDICKKAQSEYSKSWYLKNKDNYNKKRRQIRARS